MGHLCFKRAETTRRSRLNSLLLVSQVIIFDPGDGPWSTFKGRGARIYGSHGSWERGAPLLPALFTSLFGSVKVRTRVTSGCVTASEQSGVSGGQRPIQPNYRGRCLEWQCRCSSAVTVIYGSLGYYVSYLSCQCPLLGTIGLHASFFV